MLFIYSFFARKCPTKTVQPDFHNLHFKRCSLDHKRAFYMVQIFAKKYLAVQVTTKYFFISECWFFSEIDNFDTFELWKKGRRVSRNHLYVCKIGSVYQMVTSFRVWRALWPRKFYSVVIQKKKNVNSFWIERDMKPAIIKHESVIIGKQSDTEVTCVGVPTSNRNYRLSVQPCLISVFHWTECCSQRWVEKREYWLKVVHAAARASLIILIRKQHPTIAFVSIHPNVMHLHGCNLKFQLQRSQSSSLECQKFI